MDYKAVLFDLDGTLLNTLDDIADSMNSVLERNGFAPHPVERYKKLIGGGVGDLSRRVLPDGFNNDDLAVKISAQMRDEYSRRWGVKSRLYPGIDSMLDGLKKCGVPRSILSNKPDDFTQTICNHYFSRWYFEIILGATERFPKKPDPTAALFIAREMGMAPDDILYLGDSGTDMKAAVAAGMYPVGALWGFRDAEELLASGARLLLQKPEELLAL
ncbi:MAG TPA: HAD family hydrolase [Spirochaetota bacterium]|nr:HAD family hydrolase [Spirochaetota bacterium]HPC41957.1 HAD family hydrolase [Spirochaetota bacterium]HPL17009.1 HAD family hydrolase [Spirochaetota bacterium]HQF06997.1 HAD family hydrolase [Spirochaetota bacterium]HQH95734.1 HAD family hydrolase [Spirochaetota bacterium]